MSEEQQDISKVPPQLQPHVYRKGQTGNPNGRPVGSISLKQYAKQMLENMTPDEREEYLQGLPKQFIWEMAEGKAETKADVTSNGKSIVFALSEVIANKNAIAQTEPDEPSN